MKKFLIAGAFIIIAGLFLKNYRSVSAQTTSGCILDPITKLTPRCLDKYKYTDCISFTYKNARYMVYIEPATCDVDCSQVGVYGGGGLQPLTSPSPAYCAITKYYRKTATCTTCPQTASGTGAPTTGPSEPVNPTMTGDPPAPWLTLTPPVNNDCPRKSQGDANCDGLVNDGDYAIWRGEFLGSPNQADFNADGKVNLIDFEIWRRSRYLQGGDISPTQPSGCKSVGQACTFSVQCCSTICLQNQCMPNDSQPSPTGPAGTPLPTAVAPTTPHGEPSSPACTQKGKICVQNSQCCSRACVNHLCR